MRTLIRVGFWLLSVYSLACRELQSPVEVARPVESPDYAVYDGLLEGLWPTDGRTGAPPRYVLDRLPVSYEPSFNF